MPLTVSEVLKLHIFKDSRMISKNLGVYNEINCVNIIEILDDLSHLQKGEFLITTAYGFKNDDIDYQRDIIKQMSSKGAAALAVQIGHYIEKIPDSFIKLADEHNIPLLELHPDVSFKEITRIILKELSSRQILFYEYTSKIGRQLTEAILDQQGFSTIVQVLSKIVERPIRIYNCIYQLIGSSEKAEENQEAADLTLLVKEGIMELVNSGQAFYEVTGLEKKGIPEQMIIPIKANYEIHGYLSALKCGKKFKDEDIAALKHAASICALELLKEDNPLKTRSKMIKDLVSKLLAETPPPIDTIQQQAEILGYDANSNYSTMIIKIKTNRKKSEPETKYMQNSRKKLHKLLNLIIQQKQLPIFLCEFDEGFLLFLSGYTTERKHIERLTEYLHAEINKYFPIIKAFIGVGSCHGNLLTVRKSYCEAEKGLITYKLCNSKNNTIFYKDLGIYRLLIEISSKEILEAFYRDTVAKIVEYDKTHKTELLNTLRVFLDNLNLNKTAEKLFIHRHTLKYRLNKIYEITGMDPMQASDRYILQTGIMVMDLLLAKNPCLPA